MSSPNEIYPLLERAKAHMECANQIFIDIEKKLAGIHPPGKSKLRVNITPSHVADTLVKSMSRRNIQPKK